MHQIDGADRCLMRSAFLLKRIASALNCSFEAFSESAPDEIAQTVELMPLWLTIEHEQDRMKVLSIVRSVASTAAVAEACQGE